MKKIGICGYFAQGDQGWGGQMVKTQTITDELINLLGTDQVKTVDTFNWKKNMAALVFKCFELSRTCENIIILPAQNGLKVIGPLFSNLNRFFHRKIHYIVIGGWLPGTLAANEKLKISVSQFDGIYVETHSMVQALNDLGLTNVKYLPNFKRLEIIETAELVYPAEEPYQLCTFSRVTKEKGIEEAIEAVIDVNKDLGTVAFSLDIYGQVDEGYRDRFEEIKKKFPDFVTYQGAVAANDSVKTLKNYCALLFPTYYQGEGFAGTILDAFASGIPVIATNWRYNAEIIHDRSDGFIYDYQNRDQLKDILKEIRGNIAGVITMKLNCVARAKEYQPEVVIKKFIEDLK